MGELPDQFPLATLSVCPSCAVPEIVGGATFAGAAVVVIVPLAPAA
jgi:hypothetical protein